MITVRLWTEIVNDMHETHNAHSVACRFVAWAAMALAYVHGKKKMALSRMSADKVETTKIAMKMAPHTGNKIQNLLQRKEERKWPHKIFQDRLRAMLKQKIKPCWRGLRKLLTENMDIMQMVGSTSLLCKLQYCRSIADEYAEAPDETLNEREHMLRHVIIPAVKCRLQEEKESLQRPWRQRKREKTTCGRCRTTRKVEVTTCPTCDSDGTVAKAAVVLTRPVQHGGGKAKGTKKQADSANKDGAKSSASAAKADKLTNGKGRGNGKAKVPRKQRKQPPQRRAPICECIGCNKTCYFDTNWNKYSSTCSMSCRDKRCGHGDSQIVPGLAPTCACPGCDKPCFWDKQAQRFASHCGETCRDGKCKERGRQCGAHAPAPMAGAAEQAADAQLIELSSDSETEEEPQEIGILQGRLVYTDEHASDEYIMTRMPPPSLTSLDAQLQYTIEYGQARQRALAIENMRRKPAAARGGTTPDPEDATEGTKSPKAKPSSKTAAEPPKAKPSPEKQGAKHGTKQKKKKKKPEQRAQLRQSGSTPKQAKTRNQRKRKQPASNKAPAHKKRTNSSASSDTSDAEDSITQGMGDCSISAAPKRGRKPKSTNMHGASTLANLKLQHHIERETIHILVEQGHLEVKDLAAEVVARMDKTMTGAAMLYALRAQGKEKKRENKEAFYSIIRHARQRWQNMDKKGAILALSNNAPTIEMLEDDGSWTPLSQQTHTEKMLETHRKRSVELLAQGWTPDNPNTVKKGGRRKTVSPAVVKMMQATLVSQTMVREAKAEN